MVSARNIKLCNFKFNFKRFSENFIFLPSIVLRYLQSLNPTSQISNNFHTKLGKIELHTTFDRKMISTWTFHQSFIIRRGNCRRQHFDWCYLNGAPKLKTLLLTHFACLAMPLQHLIFMKIKDQPHECQSFYYQNLNIKLKNLVSSKIHGSLKIIYKFSIWVQKILTSAKLCEPGNHNWYIFSLVYFFKSSPGAHHSIKFHVSSISLSRDMGGRQKWLSWPR